MKLMGTTARSRSQAALLCSGAPAHRHLPPVSTWSLLLARSILCAWYSTLGPCSIVCRSTARSPFSVVDRATGGDWNGTIGRFSARLSPELSGVVIVDHRGFRLSTGVRMNPGDVRLRREMLQAAMLADANYTAMVFVWDAEDLKNQWIVQRPAVTTVLSEEWVRLLYLLRTYFRHRDQRELR